MKQGEGKAAGGMGLWEHFTVRDGLPDMKIECIYQDRRGAMWIGTHDGGVVRYEGDGFETFNKRDGLTGDGVLSAVEDREGNLWFGTNRGLSFYDGDAFERVDEAGEYSFLWGSFMDREGNLWFGLERRPGKPAAVCRWDGKRLELIEVTDEVRPQGQSIHRIVCDDKGTLWLGGNFLYRCEGIEFEKIENGSSFFLNIAYLLPCSDNSLWIASETGLWVYTNGNFEHKIKGCRPVSLWQEQSGSIWVATYDGQLLQYNGTAFSRIRDLHTVILGGLYLDKRSRLWIGTYGMGLYCYDTTRIQIFQVEQGLPTNEISCLSENKKGVLWIGTKSGLVNYDGSKFSLFDDENLKRLSIAALLIDKTGCIWINVDSSRCRSFWIYTGEELKSCPEIPDIIGYKIRSMVEDIDNKLWFAFRYGRGFGYFHEGGIHYFASDEDNTYPNWIGDIEVDRHGNIWLGSASPAHWDGLCRYDGQRFERIDWISGVPILALYEDREGRFWMGTNEGVSCYDHGHLRSLTQKDGLSCEIITDIVQAEDGIMWIGTEGGGICCYDGRVVQTIEFPGDPHLNVIHEILQDHCGRFWFATEGGLVQYTPQRGEPHVVIDKVVADQSYPAMKEIQLSSTVSRISFHFKGKSPTEDTRYLVYRCRLQGRDQDWYQTREKQVEYPQLESGEYVFSVQAVDRDLNYSKVAEISLSVTADPRIEAMKEALGGGIQGEFIGESAALNEIKERIGEIAWTDLTVLILGETGTGKGLAARAIHELGDRGEKPFVNVNCGALPEGLIDSELFGHERGAFTGAVGRKVGKFELAEGGTLFLDEIGDLPLESQTRLLHVLQERRIARVGGTREIELDVRVIAATNRDLQQAIAEGAFREDVYYRLHVYPIRLPPLRERKEDIPLLARHFVQRFALHLHREVPRISEVAMRKLVSYDWPGNVRELEHRLQPAVILAKEGEIGAGHLSLESSAAHANGGDEFSIVSMEEHERRYILQVLEHAGGVIYGERGAAALLGMHPNTLRSRMQKLGIRRPRTKAKTG